MLRHTIIWHLLCGADWAASTKPSPISGKRYASNRIPPRYTTILLMALNYDASLDPETVFAEHREFARHHAEPLTETIVPHQNDRTVTRRLPIGYVSGDFRTHSVAHFIEPVLAEHDHKTHEVFCYSNHALADAVTQRLQSHADHWRAIAGKTDDDVARQIKGKTKSIFWWIFPGTPNAIVYCCSRANPHRCR